MEVFRKVRGNPEILRWPGLSFCFQPDSSLKVAGWNHGILIFKPLGYTFIRLHGYSRYRPWPNLMQSLDIFSVSWILAFGAVLVAAFVRGVPGFGLALVLAPILLLLMNAKSTVVVNLLLAPISNFVILPFGFRHIHLKGIIPMAISTVPGIIIGPVLPPSLCLRLFAPLWRWWLPASWKHGR